MTTDTNIKKILKERARVLQASLNENEDANTKKVETLEFLLSNEKYAIESEYVSEVVKIYDLTPLPCTPSFIVGIINKRGQIISIVDIKKFFNLPDKGITNLNRVIIVQHNDMEFGILSDEIIGNSTLDLNTLQNDIPPVNKIADNYILGLTKERLIVLNIKELLLDEKLIVNEII